MPFSMHNIDGLTSCESSDNEETLWSNANISDQQWTSVMNLLPKVESHPGEYRRLRSCMENLFHLPMNRKAFKIANCSVFKQRYKIVKYEVSTSLNLKETHLKVVEIYNSCRFTFFACLVAYMSLNSESYAPFEKDNTTFEDLYQNSQFANKVDYPNLFKNLSVSEVKLLSKYREMMQLALVLIPSKYNKELLKNVCAMLEGSNKKYITGGKKRATPETLRRVFLFEHYGGVKPETREYRKISSPGSGSSGGPNKRKCDESECSSSDDETSSVASASSSGSASKRVRAQANKQSGKVEAVAPVVVSLAPFVPLSAEEMEAMMATFVQDWSRSEADELNGLLEEVLRDEISLNFGDLDFKLEKC